MNGNQKEVLKQASEIIKAELKAGREVKVPGFGKLYLSRVKWLDNDKGIFGKVNTVRFKPFGQLKEAVGDRQTEGTLGEHSGGFIPKAAGGIPGIKPRLKPEPEGEPGKGKPEPKETPEPEPEGEPGNPKPDREAGSGKPAPVIHIHR